MSTDIAKQIANLSHRLASLEPGSEEYESICDEIDVLEDELEGYYDEHQPSELTEWLDYDPDC